VSTPTITEPIYPSCPVTSTRMFPFEMDGPAAFDDLGTGCRSKELAREGAAEDPGKRPQDVDLCGAPHRRRRPNSVEVHRLKD
jgi:hypothetical protein